MSAPSPWPIALAGQIGAAGGAATSISSRRNAGLPDATVASPQTVTLPNGGTLSTVFVFQSIGSQNAANSVYTYASTTNAAYKAAGSSSTYRFKTDYERMQYLQGQFAQARGASGY
jgi:hypothetical protein